MPAYTSQYFGGTATISVATFADLPASGTTDQRIAITGESALFNTATYPAIVRWSGTAWELESCAATYLNVAAVEFASGTWTGTGGTVGTKSGAAVVDTTYNESWVWNTTNSLFVPDYLGTITIANQKRIKGDSLTLEPGWTATQTYSGTGGLATLTTDGSKLTFYANGAATVVNSSVVNFNDADRTTTSNFYMKCLMSRATDSNWSGAPSDPTRICFFFEYITVPSTTTGRVVAFGDGDTTTGTGLSFPGKFFQRNTSRGISAINGHANRGGIFTTETLVQFRIISGTSAQVKIGNGSWHDLAVSNCGLPTGSTSFFSGTTFTFGVDATSYTTNKAQGTLRYLQAIRYT